MARGNGSSGVVAPDTVLLRRTQAEETVKTRATTLPKMSEHAVRPWAEHAPDKKFDSRRGGMDASKMKAGGVSYWTLIFTFELLPAVTVIFSPFAR